MDLLDIVGEVKRLALKDAAEKIKPQAKAKFQDAINEFYGSASPGNYGRTMGFLDTIKDPVEIMGDDTLTLHYTFSSGDVSVNSWDSPWGITYPGDPELAFVKAFAQGYHGGPKPLHGLGHGWYWGATQKTDPVMVLLWKHITSGFTL